MIGRAWRMAVYISRCGEGKAVLAFFLIAFSMMAVADGKPLWYGAGVTFVAYLVLMATWFVIALLDPLVQNGERE